MKAPQMKTDKDTGRWYHRCILCNFVGDLYPGHVPINTFKADVIESRAQKCLCNSTIKNN